MGSTKSINFEIVSQKIAANQASEAENPRFTVLQAAEYLSVSPSTMNRWRTENRGPQWVKFGGRVFYRLNDLDAVRP